MRTEPEPGEVVQYSFAFTVGSWKTLAETFKSWQHFVNDPDLTRKFASQCIVTEAGLEISGTYYGSKAEYDSFDVEKRFPGKNSAKAIVLKDYLGLVGHWAEESGLRLGGAIPNAFYSKTLTFNGADLIADDVVDKFFAYMDKAEKGTLLWFVIFDLAGGAINDIAQDATAYSYRDALFYMQSYAIELAGVSQTTKKFLRGINETIKAACDPLNLGAYPGYVDPMLANPQQEYWRTNLPRLEQIKKQVDPLDVFHNPQSVRPAGSKTALLEAPAKKAAKVKSILKKRH